MVYATLSKRLKCFFRLFLNKKAKKCVFFSKIRDFPAVFSIAAEFPIPADVFRQSTLCGSGWAEC